MSTLCGSPRICWSFLNPIVVAVGTGLNAMRIEKRQWWDAGNVAKGQWHPQMPMHPYCASACLETVLKDTANGLPHCNLQSQCKCICQFLCRQCYHTIFSSNDAAIRGTDIRAIMPLQLPSSPAFGTSCCQCNVPLLASRTMHSMSLLPQSLLVCTNANTCSMQSAG